LCYIQRMGCLELLFGAMIWVAALGALGCANQPATPPIGRVSAVVGAVQYRPDGGDWSSALVNEPVAVNTGLRSAKAAQAELRIAGDRIALADGGELKIVRLDRGVLQIVVAQGRIGIHLDKKGPARTVEIDLPQGGVWLAAPGDYDIAAGEPSAPARIAMLAGKVQIGGGLSDSVYVTAAADSFSDWWRNQDQGDAAAAAKYVSPSITGAEMLAANGSWESEDTYGNVWYPNGLAEDWAPYRYGRWRFLPPAGWTWIDDAAWGFAPTHYGRWAHINARWGWVPGPHRDPAYSPATAAFLGTAGVGLSRPGDGGAAVAWFALAPGEVPNDPDAPYRNRLFASVVPRQVFAGGKPVQPALIQLPDQRLADAPIILDALGIAPSATAAVSAKPVRLAAAAPPQTAPSPAVQVRSREVFLLRMHNALTVMARKKPVAVNLRQAMDIARARATPSTLPPRSAHNRQHLAVARGGARD
jgi:hypothetical protein